jgi:hypothetical protein
MEVLFDIQPEPLAERATMSSAQTLIFVAAVVVMVALLALA